MTYMILPDGWRQEFIEQTRTLVFYAPSWASDEDIDAAAAVAARICGLAVSAEGYQIRRTRAAHHSSWASLGGGWT